MLKQGVYGWPCAVETKAETLSLYFAEREGPLDLNFGKAAFSVPESQLHGSGTFRDFPVRFRHGLEGPSS